MSTNEDETSKKNTKTGSFHTGSFHTQSSFWGHLRSSIDDVAQEKGEKKCDEMKEAARRMAAERTAEARRKQREAREAKKAMEKEEEELERKNLNDERRQSPMQ